MIQGTGRTRVKHSDEVIEAIRKASSNMSFEDYAQATGLEKEFIFKILKGEIEEVDENTLKKLTLVH
jgi:cyanate lyase